MEKQPTRGTQEKIPIQPIGSYFEIDNDGYIVNPASVDKLQSEWKPLLGDMVETYKQNCGNSLHSIYLRGSVARGEAIASVSDVDSYAYVTQEEKVDTSWIKEVEQGFLEKYPFVQGIEFGIDPLKFAEEDKIMLLQSICLYGEDDLTKRVSRIKPGRDAVVHVFTLNTRLEWFEKRLQKIDSDEDIRKACVWLMKTFLRSGFELCMGRSQSYTRDLYPCYETFSRYYPDREPQMQEFLNLALNPVADKQVLKSIAGEFSSWLQTEAKQVYP